MLIRLIPIFFMLILAVGMAAKRPVTPIPTPPPIEIQEELPARSERLIKVEVTSLKGFDNSQEARFQKIVTGVEKVVNLKAFEEKVKAHTYKGKNYFVDTTDTPVQVYEKITSADWKLEYRLEWIMASSTIGYTYPSVTWIALNSRKWSSLSDAEIAANICHEYGGHKFGRYNHSQKWNEARDYSAPYGLGTICKDLYKRVIK